MYAVVSLLDEVHHEQMEDLWREFKEKLGFHGVSQSPIPHFSYHVAQRYDIRKLTKLLTMTTKQIRPFKIRTNGLGIFTGIIPVLYVPIMLDKHLRNIHHHMWRAVSEVAKDAIPYYHPDNWMPHITVTHGDVDHEMLPQVIRLLSERDFNWEITVNNIAIIGGDDEPHRIISEFSLS
ncbi:MAG: 2'-5' RNA ligase family protein [Chloroflexi bacterium]|nr:MAG: 2'-5' RNA ligase family protein [Chloroflexota bacterium]